MPCRQAAERLLPTLERKEIIRAAMEKRSLFIQMASFGWGGRVVILLPRVTPELSVRSARLLCEKFLRQRMLRISRHPEALGDYREF